MSYRYLAYTPDGQRTKGTLNVENEAAAERILWGQGLTIVDLTPERRRLDLMTWFPSVFAPRRQEIIIFSQQLANLIESGVAIVSALQLLCDEVSSKALRPIVRDVLEDVRSGTPLSAAMEKHAVVFPPIYCRMIQVGERTGNLGQVLRQMTSYMEKENAMAGKVRGAMTYPAFILAMAAGVVTIIMNFTLPPLMRLYAEFDAQLPWATVMLISVTDFFLKYRVAIFVAVSALALGIGWYTTTPSGRRQLDTLLLKIPVIGKTNVQGTVSRMSRTLATLLRAGLGLPESLELTADTVHNVVLRESVRSLQTETLQGRGLAEPLSRIKVFPGLLSQMTRVGEETGTLDDHLETIAGFYEEEVDRTLKTLSSLIEPAMIVLVGVIVGFVAISVIMPMYSLLGAIH